MAVEQEKKRGPGRPPGSKNRNIQQEKRIEEMQKEYDRQRRIVDVIWGITLFALGVFLLFTVIFNTTGTFGKAIHDACKGVFGDIAYTLPFVFFIFSGFLIAGKLRHVGIRSSICGFLIVLNMCLLNSYRFVDEAALRYSFKDIAQYYIDSVAGEGGGALGMEIASLLVKFLGKPGLLIVAITALLISIFLVANTPISRFFDSLGAKLERRRLLKEMQEADAASAKVPAKTAGSPPLAGDETPSRNRRERSDHDDFVDTIVLPTNPSKTLLRSLWMTEPEAEPQPAAEPRSRVKEFGEDQLEDRAQMIDIDEPLGRRPREAKEADTDFDIDFGRDSENAAGKGTEAVSRDTFIGSLFKKISGTGRGLGSTEEDDYGYRGRKAMGLESDRQAKQSPDKQYGLTGYEPSEFSNSFGLDGHIIPKAAAGTGLSGASVGTGAAGIALGLSGGSENEVTGESPRSSLNRNKKAQSSPKRRPEPDDDIDSTLIDNLDMTSSDAPYVLPPISLLRKPAAQRQMTSSYQLEEKASLLEKTLNDFGVDAKVLTVTQGASVTRYEVQPATGVKVSSITRLSDDIALNLRAKSIRIEAPIPGKAAVGIEVENDKPSPVLVRQLIESDAFQRAKSKISFAVGKDISGNDIVADLKGMPHLLIAGATGSGKSVCVNTIITSFLYKAKPSELKLIMIDPKVVELANYNGIPHMLTPVVTDAKKASRALAIAVQEMDKRYELFAQNNVKDLESYNEFMRSEGRHADCKPQIVIIIDELADLMMAAPTEVETSICRLAQKARAAGMHLIVATQRPSVDVVTGLIKANIPSRIAFSVASQVDSRTILDIAGAEKLLGKGDMLFSPVGSNKPYRVQGPFITDAEIDKVIRFVKREGGEPVYDEDLRSSIESSDRNSGTEPQDELTEDAIAFILKSKQASVSMLQRRFRIGYNRAARIIDEIEDKGVIGPSDGSRPRQVLFTEDEYYGVSTSSDEQGIERDLDRNTDRDTNEEGLY